MRKIFFRIFVSAFAMLLMVGTASAQQREDDASRASKNAEATGMIGDAKVRITYGAPLVKGRTVFGGLVKWGGVWRAGANEATTVTFSEDVKVGGKDLAAGTYAFFLIPNEEGPWTAIFNTVANQWGAFDHDASKDALRADAMASSADHQEALMYAVEDDAITMHWGMTKVSVKVEG